MGCPELSASTTTTKAGTKTTKATAISTEAASVSAATKAASRSTEAETTSGPTTKVVVLQELGFSDRCSGVFKQWIGIYK